jgi:hypothetical protein
VTAATTIATETTTGWNPNANAAMTSRVFTCVRPIFGLIRRLGTGRL